MDVAAELDAPAERVWELIAETARWPEWGPSVVAVDPPAARVAPGLRGRVRTPAGFSVPFEITEVEPGRAWRWRVAGVAATGHRVEGLGDGRCRVVFEVPRWAAPYALVCRIALRRIARLAARPAGRSP
jgi:uncharacterized protein YndB with AHSA1/START domain